MGWNHLRAGVPGWDNARHSQRRIPEPTLAVRAILVAVLFAGAGATGARGAEGGVAWQCTPVGSGAAVALLPDNALGAVVNRHEGLYEMRIVGLMQSGERVFLLGTGRLVSRYGLRAETIRVAPAGREFVQRRHVFRMPSRPGGERRAGRGFVCVAGGEAGAGGPLQLERGEVVLAAGRSVSLVDPSEPAVTVELRAGASAPMRLRNTVALGSRLGVYAGVMRGRGQPSASIAVADAAGRIAFKAAPDPREVAATTPDTRGGVDMIVSDTGEAKNEKAPAEPAAAVVAAPTTAGVPEPAPESRVQRAKPQVAAARVANPPRKSGGVSPAKAPRAAAKSGTTEPAIAAARAGDARPDAPRPAVRTDAARAYRNAMRSLIARHGFRPVRSVSEMTYVHPAVDAFRAALR